MRCISASTQGILKIIFCV